MRKSKDFNVSFLLTGLAIVVIASGLARFALMGGGISSHKVNLTFWNGFTGPDGIVMLHIIEEFNKENPDVAVQMQRIPWGTYYNKLTVAGMDDRAPAVFVVHADQLPRLRRAGFIGPANSAFEGPRGIDPTDFDPYLLDRVKFAGAFAGVPLDIHPQGMYCNSDMLRAAGLVDSQGQPHAPKDRTEFIFALEKLSSSSSPSENDKQWGFALTAWDSNMRTLMPQFDGKYLDASGNSILNCPQNVEALNFLVMLCKQKKVPPPSNGLGWFGFRQKKVAIVWDGIFMLGDLKRVNTFQYVGAPIPTIGKHPGTLANSHVLCIRKGLSPRDLEASIRFIRYLSNHGLEWAEAGQVPARRSLRKTSQFMAMQVQHAFAEQIPWMMYPPKTPVLPEILFIMGQAVEHAVRQTSTAQKALDDANKSAQEVIDRDRREHPEETILRKAA